MARQVVNVCRELGASPEARVLALQAIRSATSVAANYRSVCRARSRKDFIAKLGVVIEEADETMLWLELIEETGLASRERIIPLSRELNEFIAILVASQRTARLHS
jgi:four helix bundle protein